MEEQRKVNIKVISISGHDEFALVPEEAVNFIKEKCEQEGKWAYLDSDYVNTDTLTESDLIGIEEVMLANVLRGGEDSYKTVTSFVNQEQDFQIYVTNDTIQVSCNKDRMGVLIKYVEIISEYLLSWLTVMARKEVSDVAHQVGADIGGPYANVDPDIDVKVIATPSPPANMTPAATTGLSLVVNYDVETDILNIVYDINLWYPTLYAREYIAHVMVSKLNDFAKNNIDKIREAVNY